MIPIIYINKKKKKKKKKTRPDIGFVVNQVARFSENSTETNLNASIQTIKYFKSIKGLIQSIITERKF